MHIASILGFWPLNIDGGQHFYRKIALVKELSTRIPCVGLVFMHKELYKEPKQQSGQHVPRGVLIQSGTFVLSHHQMRPHNVITRGGQNTCPEMGPFLSA